MHQGLLKPGERDVLKVKVIAGQAQDVGSTKNGVTSNDDGPWSVSFVIGRPTPTAQETTK